MSNKNKYFTLSIISQKQTYRVTYGLTDASKLTIFSKIMDVLNTFVQSSDEILYITIKPTKIRCKSLATNVPVISRPSLNP